ncbi:hypothetical protein EJ994_16065 [Maribacter sp. MJ134]|nr:hypothetical protein EJ994_16065 [Maribacter sp. MJ134]
MIDSNREFKNISSYGNWEVKNRLLVVNFRTVKYPKIEDDQTNYYHIKRNKLTSVFPISKEEYLDLITKIEENGLKDSLKIGSYRKFKRKRGKTFKNFQGKMGKQFFKKVENIECED